MTSDKERLDWIQNSYDMCKIELLVLMKANAELEAENARITDAYKLLIDKLNEKDDNEINISP